MSDHNKANDQQVHRCQKKVSDHTGFHWWPCGKPAKFVAKHGAGTTLVCGIHANMFRRWKDAHVAALQEVKP